MTTRCWTLRHIQICATHELNMMAPGVTGGTRPNRAAALTSCAGLPPSDSKRGVSAKRRKSTGRRGGCTMPSMHSNCCRPTEKRMQQWLIMTFTGPTVIQPKIVEYQHPEQGVVKASTKYRRPPHTMSKQRHKYRMLAANIEGFFQGRKSCRRH